MNDESTGAFAGYLLDIIIRLCDVLGLIVLKKEEVLDEDIEALIEERQAARKAKISLTRTRSARSFWIWGSNSRIPVKV